MTTTTGGTGAAATARRRRFLRRRRRQVNADGAMTLMEHLQELRKRLFIAAVGILLGAIIGFIFFGPIFDFLKAPYCQLPTKIRASLDDECVLYSFGPLDQFKVRFKVAILAGVVMSAPLWLYQLWSFITPGLRRSEKKIAIIFVSAASLLFLAGGALAYLTLDKGLHLLLSFAPGTVTALEVTKYLAYVTAMLLVFGLSFEFPLIVVMLNAVGLVSHRKLVGWWRSVVFGIFVFAGVATPSQDPFTMTAMAVPMCLLYGAALLVTRSHDRRKARRLAAQEAELEADLDSPSDISQWVDDEVH